MRLPWEKELGETPQGVLTTEEAHVKGGSTKVATSCGNVDRPYVVQGHRKASYFPTNPYPSNVKDPFISRLSLTKTGALGED